jgi:exosortase H (IPTLxxWG-CTERM-specific)
MPSTKARGGWLAANKPMILFVVGFGVWIGAFSLLFQLDWFDKHMVVPMTETLARISNVFIRMLGFDTVVEGTIITGSDAFSVNILKGCNGAYVIAIYLSAVFAFPSTWKEKALGALIGIPAVQVINLARVVSLYYIGVRHPSLFESFHYHVWQTIVILLSMAVWIAWAELLVKVPRR